MLVIFGSMDSWIVVETYVIKNKQTNKQMLKQSSFSPSLQSDMTTGRMIKALLEKYDKNTRPNFETGKFHFYLIMHHFASSMHVAWVQLYFRLYVVMIPSLSALCFMIITQVLTNIFCLIIPSRLSIQWNN